MADRRELEHRQRLALALWHYGQRAHETAINHGFWDNERNDAEMIALIHSELSEMLEAIRAGNPMSEKIPNITQAEEEAADVLIRLLDMAQGRGFNLADAVLAKLDYNDKRPHKHGKAF